MKNLKTIVLAALAAGLISSCKEDEIAKKEIQAGIPGLEVHSKSDLQMSAGAVNKAVSRNSKQNVRLFKAEYLASGKGNRAGNTVFFNDRGNKQLDVSFAPALSLDGRPDISYHFDRSDPSQSLSVTTKEEAIDRAMKSWEEVTCSNMDINKIASAGRATGWVSEILGFGGSSDYVADINHAGWLPGSFFELVAPGGGDFILAVTFTIIFVDEAGNAVDTDNNKKIDVAWTEIYYNDNFTWNIGSTYDVETVALHEAGHGLSQAHFGKSFISGNGKLHFAPQAVMNAAYSGIQTKIGKTDLAGHCSIWASWPSN